MKLCGINPTGLGQNQQLRGQVALRPPVRAQIPTGKLAPGRQMDRHGLILGSPASALDFVENPKVNAAVRGERGKGAGEPEGLHDNPKLDDSSNRVKGNIYLTFLDEGSKNGRMVKTWHQRDFFRALVDAKVQQGVSKEQQAREAGIAPSTLVTHYSGDREPGKKTLKLIAAYYQVELSSLTDDPGAPIEGVSPDAWARLTPAKRLVLRSVAQKIGPDDVTDATAQKVWRAIESLVETGKIKPPRS